uniref:Uncharacterized protein n=1 Tax=Magallana gigas TaxID=29159 RepID=A0A8W8MI14_MAGGI
MQSAVKKKEAQRRKNLTQTGGGPSQLPMLKPWEEKILQLIPQSAISGIEDGVDTSEVRSSPQMSQKPSCLEIQPFIVTEVPAEELENLDTNSDVPVVSQSEVSALKVSLSEKMGTCPVAGAGMQSSMALLWRRQQHSMILTHFEGV